MSLQHQIALTLIRNIGLAYATALLAQFGDAEQIVRTPKSKLMKVTGIKEKRTGGRDFDSAMAAAEEELKFIEKNGIRVIFYTDFDYSKRLKNCADGPVLL